MQHNARLGLTCYIGKIFEYKWFAVVAFQTKWKLQIDLKKCKTCLLVLLVGAITPGKIKQAQENI